MGRIQIRDPGEYYSDMLKVEAYLKGGRSIGEEACNLLCARLMQRQEIRDRMLAHLALKRGMGTEALVLAILDDNVPAISESEMTEIQVEEVIKTA